MSKYRIKVKNPVYGVPLNYIDVYNQDQFELLGYSRDLVETFTMSESFLQLYFAQGNKGHFTSAMKELYYVDKNGRAVIPYKRLLMRKVRTS
jgi:hypothetical protein